jgi:hypothetical protein
MSDIFDVPKVLRFHAQPERIFDHSNDTVLVTRTLLTNTADEIDRLRSQVERKDKALRNVQKLISEAAMTGFNHKDGDWPERLFESQQVTSAALKATVSSDERGGVA